MGRLDDTVVYAVSTSVSVAVAERVLVPVTVTVLWPTLAMSQNTGELMIGIFTDTV
jgi:hypothetical protein